VFNKKKLLLLLLLLYKIIKTQHLKKKISMKDLTSYRFDASI
jgi:hypothetical protein